MAYLELHDIKKSYFLGNNEFPVLKGINLTFERGDFVSILGESGGGKSTLMNIIGGLDREFTGTVKVDGQLLDHHQEKKLDDYRRATIGHIYQAYNLIAHLTVLDNVMVPLTMTTLSTAEKKARALQLIHEVGLDDQIDKYPKQLSGGQKQRVAIARALTSDPQIIIADEPTGALDSENTQEVLGLLDKIAKDGKLVIAVTHSQDVAQHGTRIVHLADGQIDHDERLKDAYPLPDNPTHIKANAMPLMEDLRLSFKHLMYNFWRNSLIMIGVAIGLFAVIIFNGLGRGVNGYIKDQVNSMVNPQWVQVIKNPNGKKMNQQEMMGAMQNMAANPQATFISKSNQDRLKKVDGISKVEPGYTFAAYRISYGGKEQNGTSLSTWSSQQKTNTIKHGHLPGHGEMVISRQEASQLLGAKKYKNILGKQVTLRFNWVDKQNHPVQISTKVKVVGLADGTGASSSVNYQTILDCLSSQGAAKDPNTLAVKASRLDQVDASAKRINDLKDKNGKRILGALTVGSLLKRVNHYVRLASDLLAGVAGISLLVSALMIIVTMYMSVSERTKEIGILRALGGRKKDVRRLFTSESILIGIFAALIAMVIAYLASLAVNNMFYSLIKYQIIQLTPAALLTAGIAALLISFIAALMPARRAANLNPIDALASE